MPTLPAKLPILATGRLRHTVASVAITALAACGESVVEPVVEPVVAPLAGVEMHSLRFEMLPDAYVGDTVSVVVVLNTTTLYCITFCSARDKPTTTVDVVNPPGVFVRLYVQGGDAHESAALLASTLKVVSANPLRFVVLAPQRLVLSASWGGINTETTMSLAKRN